MKPSLAAITCLFSVLLLFLAGDPAAAMEKGRCQLMDPASGPCRLSINDTVFQIGSDGQIVVRTADKQKAVSLPLPLHFYIESVRYAVFNAKAIFTFEITDDDYGSALIMLFNLRSVDFVWTADLSAFNPSAPLVADKFLYIGGIGTVAKLSLDTGDIIWQHADLYENDTGAFHSFAQPVKSGNVIIFKEQSDATARHKAVREIRVDDTTGEIIRR